jgi:hypothetical protein
MPIGNTPIGKTPLGKTPLGKAPLGKAPIVTRASLFEGVLLHRSECMYVTWERCSVDVPFATARVTYRKIAASTAFAERELSKAMVQTDINRNPLGTAIATGCPYGFAYKKGRFDHSRGPFGS